MMIGNVGFPMAVTAFLLVRVENKLAELATSIHELSQAIEKIC